MSKESEQLEQLVGLGFIGKEVLESKNKYADIPKGMLKQIPKKMKGEDPKLFVKLFLPGTRWTWFIAEINGLIAYGYVISGLDLNYDEWGSFYLKEVQQSKNNYGVYCERDTDFKPKRKSELQKGIDY
jgi:hypothetical protein